MTTDNNNAIILSIGDETIECLNEAEVDVPTSKNTSSMEFYMKRLNKLYFRGSRGKIIAEFTEIPQELTALKKGDKYEMNWG